MNQMGSLLLAVTLACLASSCSLRLPVSDGPLPDTGRPAPVAATDEHVLVWLTSDKWHTGMVFPYPWLLEGGFIPPAGFPEVPYVTMSWGNHDAYSPEGLKGPTKWAEVILTPTPSVMELIPIRWSIAEVCPHQRIWRKLVTRDRAAHVAHFLNQCSRMDASGRPVVVRPSSWGGGVQLESRHKYFLPRVCNVWTAQAVEALGGEVNPFFSYTAEGLIRQVEAPPNNFELIWPGGGMPDAELRYQNRN